MRHMNKNIVSSLALLGLLSVGVSQAAEPGDWTDTVTIGGDLRLRIRYEHIDDDKKSDTRDRFRGRSNRARIKMSGQVNDQLKAGFQFASGSDDPTSTNETF